ncbi:MAG: DegV family protein [Acidimicrobiaceae bacterium]|nr:DegV family protein [Acidimicrobiaceae bacterium]
MTVGIVTDSSCDLSAEELEGTGIEVVPLYIRFGSEEFLDREEITVEDFYKKMAAADELPQTAAPSPGRFEQAFRRRLTDGCDSVVCINLSAAISATMQSASQAAAELRSSGSEADVRVLDSRSVTAGLGTLVLQAHQLASQGADADEIESFVSEATERTRVFGTLDTLENLRKGGRIGGAQALLGSMLSIKPIVDISSGEVAEAAKQRTRRKALSWLRDQTRDAGPVQHLAVMHGEAADVDQFCEMLAEVHSGDIRVSKIGPVVGTHAGAGVLGMAYQVAAP